MALRAWPPQAVIDIDVPTPGDAGEQLWPVAIAGRPAGVLWQPPPSPHAPDSPPGWFYMPYRPALADMIADERALDAFSPAEAAADLRRWMARGALREHVVLDRAGDVYVPDRDMVVGRWELLAAFQGEGWHPRRQSGDRFLGLTYPGDPADPARALPSRLARDDWWQALEGTASVGPGTDDPRWDDALSITDADRELLSNLDMEDAAAGRIILTDPERTLRDQVRGRDGRPGVVSDFASFLAKAHPAAARARDGGDRIPAPAEPEPAGRRVYKGF